MAARGMAFLDGELFFKSTGTSNPGRNYPGIWLPSSGISPRIFLLGDIISFHDINRRAIDENTGRVLKHEAPASRKARRMFQEWVRKGESEYSYSIVDKRFHLVGQQRTCLVGDSLGDLDGDGTLDKECESHIAYRDLVRKLKSDWVYDSMRVTKAGSLDDVRAGRYIFDRFFSLKSLAVSVRLAPSAWRANGYWQGAMAILRAAATAGLATDPADLSSQSDISYTRTHGLLSPMTSLILNSTSQSRGGLSSALLSARKIIRV